MQACDIRGAGLKVPATDVPAGPQFAGDTGAERSLVLGGGCFWCVEAVFVELAGVSRVVSGYAGGSADTADYRSVCSGTTDHAEVIRIDYNPQEVGLGTLLRIFFAVAHDPTQLDRQGNDRGRQYRSAIFYSSDRERDYCAVYIKELDQGGYFQGPIVTTLEPLETFFEAEAYHQEYAARNPGQPYIAFSAAPKVAKLKAGFDEVVKK